MADRTLIEVTEATWNPVTGCTPISEGCRRCYASRFAKRLAGRYGYPKNAPFEVTIHPDRFDQPARWKKPRHIFACSMGDLFHGEVPDETIDRIVGIMLENPRHTYMVITKRARRMAVWLSAQEPRVLERLQDILWLGVTAENQTRAQERIPLLLEHWPGRKLACVEPILGPVDLSPWLTNEHGLDWVICGGETGAGGEPADPDHVRSVRDACVDATVPFFFKHFGGPNKKLTGRVLDGKTWDETPGRRAHNMIDAK